MIEELFQKRNVTVSDDGLAVVDVVLAYAPYGWVRRGLQIIVISRKKALSSRCQSCMAEEPHLTIRQFKQQTKNGKQQQNDSKVISLTE